MEHTVITAGQQTATRLTPVLQGTGDQALRTFARALLGLLVSPWSVAVNRAAVSSDTPARLVLEHGRHRIGPIVETYLADLDRAGVLRVPTRSPHSASSTAWWYATRRSGSCSESRPPPPPLSDARPTPVSTGSGRPTRVISSPPDPRRGR